MRFIVVNKKIIILLIFMLFICSSCKYNDINIDIPVSPSKEELVNEIIEYDSSFDSELLSYIYDEYGKMSLIEILSYMKNNNYSVITLYYGSNVTKEYIEYITTTLV